MNTLVLSKKNYVRRCLSDLAAVRKALGSVSGPELSCPARPSFLLLSTWPQPEINSHSWRLERSTWISISVKINTAVLMDYEYDKGTLKMWTYLGHIRVWVHRRSLPVHLHLLHSHLMSHSHLAAWAVVLRGQT